MMIEIVWNDEVRLPSALEDAPVMTKIPETAGLSCD